MQLKIKGFYVFSTQAKDNILGWSFLFSPVAGENKKLNPYQTILARIKGFLFSLDMGHCWRIVY